MSKRNTVKASIEKEKENLIALLPKQFQERFREESFVGGGAIYSLYNNQKAKDYDFFLDNEDLAKDIRDYFTTYLVEKKKKDGEDISDRKLKFGKYRNLKLIISDNAITIGNYQIITQWVGSPKDVVEEFDFKHNQFYVYKGNIDTFSEWDFLEDNRLRFNDKRPRDISGCIIRAHKFLERGFTITNEEMAKMLLKLKEAGFNEREMEILENAKNQRFY